REIEDRLLAEPGRIEIAVGDDQLVILAAGFGDDLPVRIDDYAAGDQRIAVLDAALGDCDNPSRVLVGTRLQGEPMMEQPLARPLLCLLRIDRWRVVAEHDQLDALQSHHAVGFRPAAIVAYAHADDAAQGAPYGKAEVPRLEIALFQMLERTLRVVFRV